MSKSFPDVLADECGGTREDYEASLENIASLDDAAVDDNEFDMSVDNRPEEFDEADLEEAEEIFR
ncbi:hypothetical protein [Halomarina ordinaria]|uniref:Uncharacterized protein n=1 Tax=Halomarina ordinaria TaxID=3033939 RepID=A0ABD5UDZ7_9EURY|nr:hypothetical protein [Halomarina sp. PSRA2]